MTSLTNAEKRKEWMDCLAFLDNRTNWVTEEMFHVCELEALRRYPDPYESTIVTTEHDDQWRILDGKVQTRDLHSIEWYTMQTLTPSDLMAFGEIAQKYYERPK